MDVSAQTSTKRGGGLLRFLSPKHFLTKGFLTIFCSVIAFHIVHDLVIYLVGKFSTMPIWVGIGVVVMLSIMISTFIERQHRHVD